MKTQKPLILVTNDDGVEAKGLKSLIEMVKPFGEVIAVAPFYVHSGKSHSITVEIPIRYGLIRDSSGAKVYGCTGTPVDSVKMAFGVILNRKPDLIVSGINHGSNASISVVYSGTMGAVIEGCLNGIPSVGFSLLDFNPDADFSASIAYGKKIVSRILTNRLPKGTCLNVNIPALAEAEIKGIKICRQAQGVWREEFDKRKDPRSGEYYWLTGYFENHENGATDTDEWALANGYISLVPVKIDLTDYKSMDHLKNMNHD